jgi:hypothetical protein
METILILVCVLVGLGILAVVFAPIVLHGLTVMGMIAVCL